MNGEEREAELRRRMMLLSEKVRSLMIEKEYNEIDVAVACRLSPSLITKILFGQENITYRSLLYLSIGLEVDIKELM